MGGPRLNVRFIGCEPTESGDTDHQVGLSECVKKAVADAIKVIRLLIELELRSEYPRTFLSPGL